MVGLYILPNKIQKFKERNLLEFQYRKDIIFKRIDFDKPLSDQGPFDILIHKLGLWYASSKHDIKLQRQLNDCLSYINSCQTNLPPLKLINKKYMSNSNNNESIMYVMDNPEKVSMIGDRWHIYKTLSDLNIVINGTNIIVPQTILIESKIIQNIINSKVFIERINYLSFPLILKPRIGVSPIINNKKNREKAHFMYIIPNIESLFKISPTIDNTMDWILQEYIDHNSQCHKIYVIGNNVFGTINDSTPNHNDINRNKSTFIDSSKFSKTPYNDQTLTNKYKIFYHKLSNKLINIFNIKYFGYDLIIQNKSNKIFLIDINFLPGYKNIHHFSGIFWGYIINQYYGLKLKVKT